MIDLLRRSFASCLRAKVFGLSLALLSSGCSDPPFTNFGNLNTPVSLAMHHPSGHLFIASQ